MKSHYDVSLIFCSFVHPVVLQHCALNAAKLYCINSIELLVRF